MRRRDTTVNTTILGMRARSMMEPDMVDNILEVHIHMTDKIRGSIDLDSLKMGVV